MAYDNTLPAGGPANFITPDRATESEGVAVDFITVDYISDVSTEITNPRAAAATGALHLSMEAIQNQGVNILGTGNLGNSDTEQTYMVRSTEVFDTVKHFLNHCTSKICGKIFEYKECFRHKHFLDCVFQLWIILTAWT